MIRALQLDLNGAYLWQVGYAGRGKRDEYLIYRFAKS